MARVSFSRPHVVILHISPYSYVIVTLSFTCYNYWGKKCNFLCTKLQIIVKKHLLTNIIQLSGWLFNSTYYSPDHHHCCMYSTVGQDSNVCVNVCGLGFTCHGCMSVCCSRRGFWLRSVQSLPGSCPHTRRAWPGWWSHGPPQQTGSPWQQLDFQLVYPLSKTTTTWDCAGRARGERTA